MPTPEQSRTEAIAYLIRDLYAEPGCHAGGPLHIQLYDYNLDDVFWNDPEFDPFTSWPELDTPKIRSIVDPIVMAMRRLTVEQRLAVVKRGEELTKIANA